MINLNPFYRIKKIKLSYLLLIIFALQNTLTNAQSIKADEYQMQVSIDVAKKSITAKTIITAFTLNNLTDTLKLLLHKNSTIQKLKVNGRNCKYFFAVSDKQANRYMPESRDLIIIPDEKPNGKFTIETEYIVLLTELKNNTSSFTNEWITLASYSSWYPVNFDWGKFNYSLTVSIPKPFIVSGAGKISHQDGKWKLIQLSKTSDIVLIASNIMQTKKFKDKDANIIMNYIGFTEAQADSIIASTIQAYNFYKTIYGEVGKANLTIVATPLKGGNAFARKDFIYMQTKGESSFEINKTISHEVAHFWWNKANVDTWEDWLNEGFAEFSTLLFIQKLISDSAYLNELKEYKEISKEAAPVWHMNRSDNNASMILYRKAPVALANFRNSISEEAFFSLLKSIHLNKINNTADLLKLIEKNISSTAKNKIIELLIN
jgi:Peptidase family M1 domain